MRSLSKSVGFCAATALASLTASAAQAADFWQVTAEARAYAYGSGAGGHFDVTDIQRTCNGTALYCSPPTSGPGAAPIIYRHSDKDTSALLSARASGSYPALNVSNPGGAATGLAYAFADLVTGTLHISNSGTAAGYASTSHLSEAGFQDTLTFGGLSSRTDFTVHVHVDGTFLGYQQPNLSFSMADAFKSLYLYQDWYDISAGVPACVGIPNCTNIALQPGNTTLSGRWVKLGEGDYVGTFTYDPLHPKIGLSMHLGAGGPGTSFADFSHTAGIAFDLPAGLSFTSGSGAFLTADISGVPEPATWATMIVGFSLVGGAMRRRAAGFVPAV